jgi:hypothetical protein
LRARVDELNVTVEPIAAFHYADYAAKVRSHSFCLITSACGEQFVADFTIEQFGFGSEMVFMRRMEYQDEVYGGGKVEGLAVEEWLG